MAHKAITIRASSEAPEAQRKLREQSFWPGASALLKRGAAEKGLQLATAATALGAEIKEAAGWDIRSRDDLGRTVQASAGLRASAGLWYPWHWRRQQWQ